MAQPQMIPQASFIRGLNASTSVINQPKGSVPRLSNLLLTKRGGFDTVDGSQVIDWYEGAVQGDRGVFEAITLFQPVNITKYYMSVNQLFDMPIPAPSDLVLADGGSGGTLAAGEYYYVVTALDGAGGETTASVEASIIILANHTIILTWAPVQNAASYNVYRGTSSGGEALLVGTGLPVTGTTYTDDGSATFAASTANIVAFPNGVNIGLIHPSTVANVILFLQTPVFGGYNVPFTVTGARPNTGIFQTGINGNRVMGFGQPTGESTTISFLIDVYKGVTGIGVGGGGTVTVPVTPPTSNTTTQVALFKYPNAAMTPISYDDTDIVALFPASARVALGGTPGGSGGSGGSGSGGIGGFGASAGPTACGGIAGSTGPLPQFAQFNNQLIIALGNGYPPQIYTDVNSIPENVDYVVVSTISAVNENAAGTIATFTTTGDHKLIVGCNVIVTGVTNPLFDSDQTFVVLTVPTPTTFTVALQITGSLSSSGGTVTPTTFPMFSTFTPSYEGWLASTQYAVNSIIQPTNTIWQGDTVYATGFAVLASPDTGFYYVATTGGTSGATQPSFPIIIGDTVSDGGVTWTCTGSSNYYYKATQGGESGTVIPAFPQTVGDSVTDGTVVWVNGGTLASSAPAPPGAAHILVYAGSLWVLNTWVNDNANGLDGPTSLRMSDINQPTSWNPINQAFLNKDDGTQGMGLATFTITAQGIPPEGSLISFKDFSTFQIAGVFGSQNFAIQQIQSDMGCTVPRSIQFVPGFGMGRYAHLGVALFDGVNDHVISEEIRPYLFPSNQVDDADITVVDQNYIYASFGFQTANPPMYCTAVPIGMSGGELTRVFCHDLVLKAWAIIDLPFPISCAVQVRAQGTNPLSIFGGFSDGVLQRWQAGDVQWYTLGGPAAETVDWSVQTPEVTSQGSDERLFIRRLILRGTNTNSTSTITVTPRINGVLQQPVQTPVLPVGDFDTFVTVALTSLRFDAVVSGSGDVEIYSFNWQVVPKPAGVPLFCG